MGHGGVYRACGKAQERPTTWGWGGEAAEIVTSPELLEKAGRRAYDSSLPTCNNYLKAGKVIIKRFCLWFEKLLFLHRSLHLSCSYTR